MYVGGTENSRVPVCMSSAREVLRFRYLLETLRGGERGCILLYFTDGDKALRGLGVSV